MERTERAGFQNLLSSSQGLSAERTGAVKGAALGAAVERPLTARTVLKKEEEKEKQVKTGHKCEAQLAKRLRVAATMVLSETRGLKLYAVVRGGIGLTKRL